MGRRSSIDDLPNEIISFINRLLADGVTLDEIKARLDESGQDHISRSAIGRYKLNQKALSAELKRSRLIAETLIRESDPSAGDSHMSRVGVEMLQAVMMKIVAAEMSGDAPAFDAKEAHFLARAFKDLSSAQTLDTTRIAKIRESTLKKAAFAVDKVVKKRGLTKETADAIRKQILGIEVS